MNNQGIIDWLEWMLEEKNIMNTSKLPWWARESIKDKIKELKKCSGFVQIASEVKNG